MNKNRAILEIDGRAVDNALFHTQFACDPGACRGACCTLPGGSGPPVFEEELPILEAAWKTVRDRVPREHRELVENEGLFVMEESGWTIRCHDRRACVFVRYESGTARCAIQQAWQEGRFDWPKPLTCHLFPLRMRGDRGQVLLYEQFDECAPALKRGMDTGTYLYDYLEDAVRRVFGDAFWQEWKQAGDTQVHGKQGV